MVDLQCVEKVRFSGVFLWKMFYCSLKSMLGVVDAWPGVEIMFIEDHARLRRWRRLVVHKVITFMQDCYICRGRYIDAEIVKLFIQYYRLGFVDLEALYNCSCKTACRCIGCRHYSGRKLLLSDVLLGGLSS